MDADRRTCEICNVTIHRASMAKHLKSKKHLQNAGRKGSNQITETAELPQQNESNRARATAKQAAEVAQRAVQEKPVPITLKPLETVQIPPSKRQKDRDFAKTMENPYYLDAKLSEIYDVIILAHNQSDLSSQVRIRPKVESEAQPEGLKYMNEEHFNQLIKQICYTYARLIGQSKFKLSVICRAEFDQPNGDEDVLAIKLPMINIKSPGDISVIDERDKIKAKKINN